MQCPDNQEWNAYLDGENTVQSKPQLQCHLKQCSLCQEAVAALQDDNRMIKDALNDMRVPSDLGAYIQGRMLKQERAWRSLKAGVSVLLLSSGLFALAGNWIPLIKWLGAALQSTLGGSLAMQMLVILGRLLTAATGNVLRGEPVGVTPTFIILLGCVAGLLVQSRKGGYGNA